jgi:predicted PurR-regulated permease PerM
MAKKIVEKIGINGIIIFFSTIGGIVAYGPIGFIVGPVILTLFISLLEIYRQHIRPELKKDQEGKKT